MTSPAWRQKEASQIPVEVIEPFPLHAVPRVWEWVREFRDRVADDFAPSTLAEFVSQWEAQDAAGRRTWAVLRDGELGGVITSNRLSPIVADAHCVFKREFWGRDTTAEALRHVFAAIFAQGVEKITSLAFRDNHALFGLVARLGFEREGTLRQHTRRRGELVDMVIVGLRRERFNGLSDRPLGSDRCAEQFAGKPHDDQHGNEHPEPVRDVQLQPHADAVPVGAAVAALRVHQQLDDKPTSGGGAVPAGGTGSGQLELQRSSG